jgi:hypothetical protein
VPFKAQFRADCRSDLDGAPLNGIPLGGCLFMSFLPFTACIRIGTAGEQ